MTQQIRGWSQLTMDQGAIHLKKFCTLYQKEKSGNQEKYKIKKKIKKVKKKWKHQEKSTDLEKNKKNREIKQKDQKLMKKSDYQ